MRPRGKKISQYITLFCGHFVVYKILLFNIYQGYIFPVHCHAFYQFIVPMNHLMLLGGYITYFIVLSLKATIKLTTEIFKAYSNHKTSVVAWGVCSTPLYNCAGRGPPFPRTVRLKICFSTKFRGSLFSQNRRTMKGLVKYCFVQKIQIFPRILLQLFIFGQMHVIFSFWGLFSRRSNFRGKFSLLP